MNETESTWDEVESLVSMSDATICSNQNDTVSIADSQENENDTGIAIVQDNEIDIQDDNEVHDRQGEEQDEKYDALPHSHNQKNTKGFNDETKVHELKDSSLDLNSEVKSTANGNMNNIEANLQKPIDIDSSGEKSSDEENLEQEELLDGGAEELPFVRSVKYLEKHEIFRLFQSLAADIVYQRPDNPLQFIVDKLEKEKEESQLRNSAKEANSNEDMQVDL